MKISGATRTFGVFGDPISHSLSPAMHNEVLAMSGIDAVYVPYHVKPAQLASAVAGIRAMNIWGVNVTIPHKVAICAHLDEIDPEARLIGAINTVVNREGRLVGYNTDGGGFLRSLKEDLAFDPHGRKVLLLGAGGAARAILVALGHAGAHWVGVANRTEQRARILVDEFRTIFTGTQLADFHLDFSPASKLMDSLEGVDLIVNATSLGMNKGPAPELPWEQLSENVCIYDIVYAQEGTALINEARTRGFCCADGLGMLAGQGEVAFTLWTGVEPPSGVMKRRILAECSGK